MSSSVNGRGGLRTMYLKHWRAISLIQGVGNKDTYVEALVELLLLLVNYAEAEVDFIGLLEVGLHAHHLRKCFLGVLEGSITIIEYSDAIPQFGFLIKVSILSELGAAQDHLPWDRTGGIVPADRQSKPAAGRPS